jgi:hypothetical protein
VAEEPSSYTSQCSAALALAGREAQVREKGQEEHQARATGRDRELAQKHRAPYQHAQDQRDSLITEGAAHEGWRDAQDQADGHWQQALARFQRTQQE